MKPSGKLRLAIVSVLVALALQVCTPAKADLATVFEGFTTIQEVGVSGLKSSYYTDTRAGNLLPTQLQVLGPGRVSYPDGVGEFPSPGYRNPVTAPHYDEGALGFQVVDGTLYVRLAGAINPLTGYFDDAWFGQGDLFISIKDSGNTIRHYALLTAWPRGPQGAPVHLETNAFSTAQSFHTSGGAGGTSLEGHLVELTASSQVATPSKAWGYFRQYSPPPVGLDYRVFAQGGTDLGSADLTQTTTTDVGMGGAEMTWYVQTWALPASWLSPDTLFYAGMHSATSCGNDQIGANFEIDPPKAPLPGAVVLGSIGLAAVGWIRRRADKAAL